MKRPSPDWDGDGMAGCQRTNVVDVYGPALMVLPRPDRRGVDAGPRMAAVVAVTRRGSSRQEVDLPPGAARNRTPSRLEKLPAEVAGMTTGAA